MDHIRANLSLGPVDLLLDLRQKHIDRLGARHTGVRVAARRADRDIAAHRLGVTPRQLRRRPGTAGQIVSLVNLHELHARLRHGPLRGSWVQGLDNRQPKPPRRGTRVVTHGQDQEIHLAIDQDFSWPPTGNPCPSAVTFLSAQQDFQVTALTRTRSGCAPRARGDGPQARNLDEARRLCSPRTRGWSLGKRELRFPFEVLPAHAGMVPLFRLLRGP